jgi:hypothetical protein
VFRIDKRPLRILDFDIENRPLHYWYGDKTTGEITAIAWSWYGDPEVEVRVLQAPPRHLSSAANMLLDFVAAYDEADMVTGHFIRGHDLPIINSALIEQGLGRLSSKLTSDTKLDLVKHGQLSVSQKNLTELLGVPKPKIDMPQASWREANRLTPAGIELTKGRVVGDIIQHKALRTELLELGLLSAPRMWHPDASNGSTNYVP